MRKIFSVILSLFFFFLIFYNTAPLLAMENQDTALDHFLNQEAEDYLEMCEKCRGVSSEQHLVMKIDRWTQLIEKRLKNNISLDCEVRIHYDGGSKSPLYFTSSQEELITITRKLLKRGANPNVITANCYLPPLYTALENRAVKTVKILLKMGAKPNDIAWGKKPLLNLACYFARCTSCGGRSQRIKNDIRNIKLLLKYGANPNIMDTYGNTPLSELIFGGAHVVSGSIWCQSSKYYYSSGQI